MCVWVCDSVFGSFLLSPVIVALLFTGVCVCVFYCVSDFRRSLSLQHCTAISLFLAARATVHACVPARASACVCVLLTLVIVALLSL